MPLLFQAVLLIGLTCYVLTTLLFFLARDMPKVNSGIGWWALSSISGGIGYYALLIHGTFASPITGEALYNIALLSWSAFLFVGLSLYLGRAVKVFYVLTLLALVSSIVAYFSFIQPSFMPAAIATALFCGVINLCSAWYYRQYNRYKGSHHWILITALCISGIHWLDYPLLRNNEAFGVLGFLLCAIISSTINIILASMAINQFKNKMIISEQKARHQARHDSLTGLKNRLALEDVFNQRAKLAYLNQQNMVIIFADLDKFKPINDNFGHEVGDQVLVTVAKRINETVSTHDVVARLGGDEFVILLTQRNTGGPIALNIMLDKLQHSLSRPITIKGQAHQIGASFGCALYPNEGADLAALLEKADQSMYANKALRIKTDAVVIKNRELIVA